MARGDRYGLSLRVAHQMQDAVSPARAQRATRVQTIDGAMKSAILAGAGSAPSAQPMTDQPHDRPEARG